MGEYADEYFRREVMSKHGFDPGSMYGDAKRTQKVQCKVCGKCLSEAGIKDHMRDKHAQPTNGGGNG